MSDFEERTNQFVMAMVLACQGDVKAQQDVSYIVGQMMRDPTMLPMYESLMQIIVGERDRAHLTNGLEGEPALLVNQILDQLET